MKLLFILIFASIGLSSQTNNNSIIEKSNKLIDDYNYEEAFRILTEAIRKDSTNDTLYYSRALAYEKFYKEQMIDYYLDSLRNDFVKAFILNPNNYKIIEKLRPYLLKCECPDIFYDQLIQNYPTEIELMKIIFLNLNLKNNYENIQKYSEIIINNKQIPDTLKSFFYMYYGLSSLKTDDTLKAIKNYEISYHLDKNIFLIQDIRNLYIELGNFEKALNKNKILIESISNYNENESKQHYIFRFIKSYGDILTCKMLLDYNQYKLYVLLNDSENSKAELNRLKIRYLNDINHIYENIIEKRPVKYSKNDIELMELINILKDDNIKYISLLLNAYSANSDSISVQNSLWQLTKYNPKTDGEYYAKYHLYLYYCEKYANIEIDYAKLLSKMKINYTIGHYPEVSLLYSIILKSKLNYPIDNIKADAIKLKNMTNNKFILELPDYRDEKYEELNINNQIIDNIIEQIEKEYNKN